MVAGSGPNLFDFSAGNGGGSGYYVDSTYTIENFSAQDSLQFSGNFYNVGAYALEYQKVIDGDLVLPLGDGAEIIIEGRTTLLSSSQVEDSDRNGTPPAAPTITAPPTPLSVTGAAVKAIDGNTGHTVGTVTVGDTVTLSFTFNTDAFITGNPSLQLNDGGVATYTGGSGGTTLTFSYTPSSGQNVSTLASTGLINGAIQDEHGNIATGTSQSFTGLSVETTPPTLSTTGTSDAAMRGGAALTLLASDLIIDFKGPGTIAGATVTIANAQTGDALSISGLSDGTVDGGAITVTGNDTSSLTLSGSATIAEYQTLLAEVTYGAAESGTDATRTFDWIVNNGALGSNTTTTTIDVVACYCPGTSIATARGQKNIENLKIGDKVRTASGALRPIKWIGRRSYSGRFVMGRTDILPICFKAGALDDNVPKRDLWISPHHAMFFKDACHGAVLIEARDLVNGVSIVQAEHVDKVEYFHIELESHDVIVAEGALSETFVDDDSRGMFHNLHEYRQLYPDATATPARYCAPRHGDDYAVEAVRRRIAARAAPGGFSDAEPRIGSLRGHVDRVSTGLIEGWMQNVAHPEAPVCVDIFADGRLIGQVIANRYRADLAKAGIGSGHHSFAFAPPAGLAFTPETIEVRRSLDRAPLMPTANAWQASPHAAVSAEESRQRRTIVS